jgi:hypothetical protein
MGATNKVSEWRTADRDPERVTPAVFYYVINTLVTSFLICDPVRF